jgi:ABC-type transporter Mla MlaB component
MAAIPTGALLWYFIPRKEKVPRSGGSMKIFMNGNNGQLQGNLTDSGVTGSCIDSLTDSLQQIETCGAKKIRIDCGRVLRADMGGLRLLYVWMQCAGFGGIELELVNLSDGLWQVIRSFGLGHCFALQVI